MACCHRDAHAFHRDSKKLRSTQSALLRRILSQNRDTWFGSRYAFASIRDERTFQDVVPISTYDDYHDAIHRIAVGEQNVLTAEQVSLFEPTSGSTTGEKLIPYTPGLRRCFLRAVRVWIWDLYSHRPGVRRGRSYWSITPLANIGRRTSGGIPIGFDSDANYLSRVERFFVERTMVVPPEVVAAPTIEAAQYATLFHLLRARDLTLISIWSPTFLMGLIHFLAHHWNQLTGDIADGRITLGYTTMVSQHQYAPQVARSKELNRIFQKSSSIHEWMPNLWPSLAIVSCWADGPSLAYANNLRQYLGDIELQPKGLLATEAFVTIPLVEYGEAALAIRSHFFEFLPANAPIHYEYTRPLLSAELTEGDRYRVLVTTEGGLYRYQLHDEVEVVGFHYQTPLLRFVGKADDISDLVGEKLDAAHVELVLQQAFQQLGVQPIYSQLCANTSNAPGYLLRLAIPDLKCSPAIQSRICEAIERGLEGNPGYKYARALGQLSPLKVELVSQGEADAMVAQHIANCVSNGQRLGNVKPTSLTSIRSLQSI